MKRAALYLRHSIADLNPETQPAELREFAMARGYEIVVEYVDHGVNGARVRRPALDRMLQDAAQDKFDALFVLSCDRLARDAKHFLHVVEELNRLGIRFMSLHERIDTEGPVGAAIVLVVSALTGLDRSLKVERIRAGMRRAQMEGRRIGRAPLDVDHAGLIRDRLAGMSLSAVARKYGLSRSSVVRFVRDALSRHIGAITVRGRWLRRSLNKETTTEFIVPLPDNRMARYKPRTAAIRVNGYVQCTQVTSGNER